MIKVFENNNIIMPFDVNNPGRNTEEFIITKVGKVSGHDYQKFEKGKDSKIVYMTADEYINECINNIFKSNYESTVTNAVDMNTVYKYVFDMKHGDIFPIPYLNYVNHQQEGRHRMLAFKLLNGEDAKAPVLVIFETNASEDEIKDYCKRKWGKADPYWVDYIKRALGLLDEEELEPDLDDEIVPDNLDNIDDLISDELDDDFDKTIEMISQKSGMSKEEIMDLDPLSLSRLLSKYW